MTAHPHLRSLARDAARARLCGDPRAELYEAEFRRLVRPPCRSSK